MMRLAQLVPVPIPTTMPRNQELATWIVWLTFIVGMTLLLSVFVAVIHFIRQQALDIKAERIAITEDNRSQRIANAIEQTKLRECHESVCKNIVESNQRIIDKHYDVHRESISALISEIRSIRCHMGMSHE